MQRVVLSWQDPVTEETEQQTVTLPATLGRAPGNTIELSSAVISANHVRLEMSPQGVVVTDLGSRNGTYVNGARLTAPAIVQPGDAIGVGPFAFVLQLERADVRLRFDWTDPTTGQAQSVVHRVPVTLGTDASCNVVVRDSQIAPLHVRFDHEGDALTIVDATGQGSVAVNGQWTTRAPLGAGAALQVGSHRFVVTVDSAARRRMAGESTIVLGEADKDAIRAAQRASAPSSAQPSASTSVQSGRGDWPPPVFSEQLVPVAALAQSGIPIASVDYGTVGGGLGSFIWVDNLLIRGVREEQIAALGIDPVPYSRYKRLCRNSQIPDLERLRSDSTSTPDNIWGFPGYAAREIWHAVRTARLGEAASLFWQIFGEPTVAQTYTPRASDVYASLDREATRIGWSRIWRFGRVRAIRKTDDGRYVIAYSTSGQSQPSRGFLIATNLHLATGYPALQFLPDLQKYREATEDFRNVVNAYEDHDHVYEHLEQHGGLVLLRGRGIVASRLIQRIYEARAKNKNIVIVQVLRSPTTRGHRYGRAEREVHHHFELQPFNWPKAAMGGDLRELLERSPPDERKKLLTDWGGTTTARRRDWIRIADEGVRDGWYQIVFGEVERVERTAEGKVTTIVRGKGPAGGETQYVADFIVDATGLDAKVKTNPLLRDLIDHYGLELNFLGRLHVSNDFEVPGLQNAAGRAFAVGSMTLGGPYAMADSFIGFQFASMRICDHLTQVGAAGLHRFGSMRSMSQWWRWARGVTP